MHGNELLLWGDTCMSMISNGYKIKRIHKTFIADIQRNLSVFWTDIGLSTVFLSYTGLPICLICHLPCWWSGRVMFSLINAINILISPLITIYDGGSLELGTLNTITESVWWDEHLTSVWWDQHLTSIWWDEHLTSIWWDEHLTSVWWDEHLMSVWWDEHQVECSIYELISSEWSQFCIMSP